MPVPAYRGPELRTDASIFLVRKARWFRVQDTEASGEHTKFSASISRQDEMSFRPTETRAVPYDGPQAEQHVQRDV